VVWLGSGLGAAGAVQIGRSFAPISTFARTYSIQASAISGAVLEFDLSRFLDWVGNPSEVAGASLVLDAPGAVVPLPAPVSVSNLTQSGGLLFFSATAGQRGIELWASDGTPEGTRLVKDLSPGVPSSNPANLVDLGGTLYFTANVGAGGTELWKSDGTEGGTVKVADIPGTPAQFTAAAGVAELTGIAAAPESALAAGRPDNAFGFTLVALNADGTEQAIAVSLARSALRGNASLDDLRADLAAALAATGVSVSTDGSTLTFSADPASGIVSLSFEGAAGLGFGDGQTSPQDVSLAAAATAPEDGQLDADLEFSLDLRLVGDLLVSLDLTLTQEGTADNLTAADLAADLSALLSAALSGAGLPADAIAVTLADGALVLTANEASIVEIVVHDAAPLGFGADQASVAAIALESDAEATPDDGHLALEFAFSLEVLSAGGETETVGVTLSDAEIADNEDLADLAADLDAALAADGIDVATDAGALVFSAADATVVSIAIHGGEMLGFAADQVSTREGDRLFFVTDRGALGQQLWASDGTAEGTLSLLEAVSAAPQHLTVVNGELFFSAFDPAAGARALWQLD